MLLHATGVVRDGRAALLTGPSGAGKSDLALRLIDRGWVLLGDDQLRIAREADEVVAHGIPSIGGLIEVRGVGLMRVDSINHAPVALVVELGGAPERMPELQTRVLLDIALPVLRLDPWPASAPLKMEYAFARALVALSAVRR